MKKEIKKVMSFLLVVFLLVGCQQNTGQATPIPQDALILHYIDVGQADATLIQGEGMNILIDCGNKADSQVMINYLKKQGVNKIDIAIGTHAHEDHIGGFPAVLKEFACDKFYLSSTTSNSRIYESLLDILDRKNIETKVPSPNDVLSIGNVHIEFYGPLKKYKDLNNSSIPLKITHKNQSFLFTGDAETEVENELVSKYGKKLQSNIFQAAHHGSSTGNSQNFLKTIQQDTVIISSNIEDSPQYGHPHIETLTLLKSLDIPIYRTDKQGNIIVTSDGTKCTITEEKEFSGNLYKK